MPNGPHNHRYDGETSYTDGHVHNYMGRTSINPDTEGHIHYLEGVTSYNNGHIHYYTDYTGPAVYIDGGHYHNYMGETQVADRHTHRFSGRTSVYRD